MATQRSANVQITNTSGGNAWILLFHNNSSNGTQRGAWVAAPGQTVGPLTVLFETGWGSWGILDYWSVLVQVQDGPAPGLYVSAGTAVVPYWKECQLQAADADQTLTLGVSTTDFDVALESGGCEGTMMKIAPYSRISHMFVVMLENHSFDNMFAMSGIPGINAATASDCNSYDGQTYCVQPSAPLSMPTDPGHEFLDVVEQLAGQGATYPSGGPYPAINNSGFAANYATTTTEGPTPPPQDIGDVMACFATPAQLPVINQLARSFAICDQWYSSLPGPTWPNRFFVHGASSSGLDDSPSQAQMAGWEVPGAGFKYPNGSIFDSLRSAGIPYRLYNDSSGPPLEWSLYSDDPQNGSPLGAVPQVSSLAGITLLDIESLSSFAADLQGPYPYPYTFIEPHYGDITGGSYEGGSSQHPMDDVYGGEHLLAAVYSAIRNSPYWETSLLIITYDEHGGLYDHAVPVAAAAPGDNPNYGYNKHGFDFKQYGVRVPAVIVSPLIAAGTVDHTLYDHSSVPKTVETLFGLGPLTERDRLANDVTHLLSSSPRTDCPSSLTSPALPRNRASALASAYDRVRRDSESIPRSGNLVGALQILRKTEIELSGHTSPELAAIDSRFNAIETRGDAAAYAGFVMEKVGVAKRQREFAGASLRRPS
jgi:phospholipase C